MGASAAGVRAQLASVWITVGLWAWTAAHNAVPTAVEPIHKSNWCVRSSRHARLPALVTDLISVLPDRLPGVSMIGRAPLNSAAEGFQLFVSLRLTRAPFRAHREWRGQKK